MNSLSRSIVLSFFLLLFFFALLETASAIPDPAAVYCNEMGYDYTTLKLEDGSEIGYCIFPDNTRCPAWDFYAGTCGQKCSYCAKKGWLTIAMTDGKDPYSLVYSACAVKAESEKIKRDSSNAGLRIVGSVSELMNLSEKLESMCSFEVDGEEQKECKESIPEIGEITRQPSKFDWRNYNGANWLTPVKSQGTCGSCWAFAIIGGIEAMLNIREKSPNFDVDLSEQYLVSDCSHYGSCCGGYVLSTLIDITLGKGLPDECCFPYADESCSCAGGQCRCTYSSSWTCSNKQCSDKCGDCSKRFWEIDRYGWISDVNKTKSYLVALGPIITSMYWDGDTPDRWDSNGIYHCKHAHDYTTHTILIVGYNDAGGYWIVKNSWGANWGPDSNGYFKLGYGECGVGGIRYYVKNSYEKFPQKITADSFEVTTGSSSGSLSDTYTKDSSYLTLDEQCGLIGCDGLSSDFTFTLPTLPPNYIFGNLDVLAYIRSTDHDFDINIWNVQTSDWEYLADVPSSDWCTVKYKICNSEEECREYFDNNRHLKLNFSHESRLTPDKNYIHIDWLFIGGKADFKPDTTPPTIESVTLDAYTTIPSATIHVTVEATDNVCVTSVTADGVALTKMDGAWEGDVTAPSAPGDYTLTIRAEDAAGNFAETTVDYSVVKPSGSIGIGVDPRLTTVSADDSALINIKLVSTENFDDIAYVYLTTEGLDPSYQANLTWFNWTSKYVKVPAGEEVKVPLEASIPGGESGYKVFYAKLESTKWTPTAMDTGIVYAI